MTERCASSWRTGSFTRSVKFQRSGIVEDKRLWRTWVTGMKNSLSAEMNNHRILSFVSRPGAKKSAGASEVNTSVRLTAAGRDVTIVESVADERPRDQSGSPVRDGQYLLRP